MASIVTFLASLGVPDDVWSKFIFWIDSGVVNIGWTIVLVTLVIKFILTPLDFWMKLSSKKNTLVQKKLAPQIAAVNKKYANNRQMANMQVAALYKKEGLNMIGSCVLGIVYMVTTLVIFFTFFNAMKDVAAYKMLDQYQEIKTTYVGDNENIDAVYSSEEISIAEKAAEKKWRETKDSWLWVSNVWVADTYKQPVPTYTELKAIVKAANDSKAKASFEEISKEEYNKVMKGMLSNENNKWNGFFILAILAAGLTFVAQWITEFGNKINTKRKEKKFGVGANGDLSGVNVSAENAISGSNLPKISQNSLKGNFNTNTNNTNTPAVNPTGSAMKYMKYIFPFVMVIFVVMSPAAFGVYVVTNSLVSVGTGFASNMLISRLTEKKEDEVVKQLEKAEKKKLKKHH